MAAVGQQRSGDGGGAGAVSAETVNGRAPSGPAARRANGTASGRPVDARAMTVHSWSRTQTRNGSVRAVSCRMEHDEVEVHIKKQDG